jgi:hypothetical protein
MRLSYLLEMQDAINRLTALTRTLLDQNLARQASVCISSKRLPLSIEQPDDKVDEHASQGEIEG